MTYDEMQKQINTLYPVNQVAKGYTYWVRTLTEKCLGMFTYTGLPDSLPANEIEYRLITAGAAGIFKHDKFGLVVAFGSLYQNQDSPYYKPVKFLYNQPALGSKTLTINKDVAILYNAEIDENQTLGFSLLIRRYARMLADIDSSINIVTVNTRATNLVTAKNQQVAKTVDEVMKKIRLGDFATINENSILDCINTFAFGGQSRNNTIQELLLARDSMLRSFLSELGIKLSRDKKERQIVDEVESDNQLLTVNLADMLFKRREGIKKVNELFKQEITVDITPEYDTESEEKQDDNI